MCNCYSPSWDVGYKPQDLRVPLEGNRPVAIDHCITHVMEYLWDHDIGTQGSCCGHNLRRPSVVIEEGASDQILQNVKKLIAQIDDREWQIFSWRRVEV